MNSRDSLASNLIACLLAVGLLGAVPAANAASAGRTILKPGENARNNVNEFRHRSRGPRIHLPMDPAYVYFDYPYYYSRGYYPTHIGGYVYYSSYFSYHPGHGGRCSNWQQRCGANWSTYRNHGSLRRKNVHRK